MKMKNMNKNLKKQNKQIVYQRLVNIKGDRE